MEISGSGELRTFIPEEAPEGVLCQAFLDGILLEGVKVMRDGDRIVSPSAHSQDSIPLGSAILRGYALRPIL